MGTETEKFPYEIVELDAEINAELLRYFHGERTGFVQVGPERYFFPHTYKAQAEKYYNFQARPSDIWIASFPRSGTTWTQEMIWLLANNLDFEAAAKQQLTERFPFFEMSICVHPDFKTELLKENAHSAENCEFIENLAMTGAEKLSKIPATKRRFIKTHFPFSLLPPSIMKQQSKLIYVLRNPFDVAVSFYHLNRLFRTQGYVGDFPRFWDYFERGYVYWAPYYSHIREAMSHRNLPNVLMLDYHDLKTDIRGCIVKVANFLNCPIDKVGMEKLVKHLDFENFRQNKSVNLDGMYKVNILNKSEAGFVRNGDRKTQTEFIDNPDLQIRAQKWMELNQKD